MFSFSETSPWFGWNGPEEYISFNDALALHANMPDPTPDSPLSPQLQQEAFANVSNARLWACDHFRDELKVSHTATLTYVAKAPRVCLVFTIKHFRDCIATRYETGPPRGN